MHLIQPLKFRTLKMGCFKMPRLQTRLQTAVFQMGITVASGLKEKLLSTKNLGEGCARPTNGTSNLYMH